MAYVGVEIKLIGPNLLSYVAEIIVGLLQVVGYTSQIIIYHQLNMIL